MKNGHRIIILLIFANVWLVLISLPNKYKGQCEQNINIDIELNFSFYDYGNNLILKVCHDSIHLYRYSDTRGPICLIMDEKLHDWQSENIKSLIKATPTKLLPYFFDNGVDDECIRSVYINGILIASIKGQNDEPCLKDLKTLNDYILNLIPFDPFDDKWIHMQMDTLKIVSPNEFISLNG